jgi:hypothetical protein
MPVNLPSETLDEIISYVEPYTDVLNIALSNKALSSVAIPQHLHYRDIRSKLHNPPLWSWLSRLDDLHAAHIRSLTIIPDHDYDIRGMSPEHLYDIRERLPAEFYGSESQPLHSLTAEDCRVAETKLISALKRMSCLHKFRWYRALRPVLDGGEDIWSTLERLGTVKELDILDVEVVGLDVVPIALSDTVCRLFGSHADARPDVFSVPPLKWLHKP